MFTRIRFAPPAFVGDAGRLAQYIADYLRRLESPGAISLAENTLESTNLKFPATQVASTDANTLDDYEEGTWTPVLTFATAGDLAVTYTSQIGKYLKIGKQVHAEFFIVTSAFTHTTASGNAQITGLGFSAADANSRPVGALQWQGITKATATNIVCKLSGASATILLAGSGSGATTANIIAADMPTGGTVTLIGTLDYIADA